MEQTQEIVSNCICKSTTDLSFGAKNRTPIARGQKKIVKTSYELYLPWECLNFLPAPQGHGSLRPTFSQVEGSFALRSVCAIERRRQCGCHFVLASRRVDLVRLHVRKLRRFFGRRRLHDFDTQPPHANEPPSLEQCKGFGFVLIERTLGMRAGVSVRQGHRSTGPVLSRYATRRGTDLSGAWP